MMTMSRPYNAINTSRSACSGPTVRDIICDSEIGQTASRYVRIL